ncbi:MAG: protein kinase, partial [Blautia sp.]|nr:protein kinase [Blautia sp.]
MKLCPSCLKQIEDHAYTCPYCGYEDCSTLQISYYLPAGTILNNRYYIGKTLGHGGFGITYIGKDTVLDRTVAIKEYYPTGLASRGMDSTTVESYGGEFGEQFHSGLDRFMAEAKKLAEFGPGQGIVQIHDCIRANNTGYIIMEYLRGCTIKDLVKKGRTYTFADASYILAPVLDTLNVVHSHDIIHRDIAPDNIFITDEGKIRLIDFGAAHYAEKNVDKTVSVVLKHGFAPEEQYKTHPRLGPWTDIYGISATLYFMVTGKKPVSSIDRMPDDVLTPPSAFNTSITPEQEAVILKGMAVRAEDRYQSAKEMKNAILRCREGEKKPKKEPKRIPEPKKTDQPGNSPEDETTVKVNPGNHPGPLSRPPKKYRGKGKLIAALAAVVLAVLAGLIGMTMAKRTPPEPDPTGEVAQITGAEESTEETVTEQIETEDTQSTSAIEEEAEPQSIAATKEEAEPQSIAGTEEEAEPQSIAGTEEDANSEETIEYFVTHIHADGTSTTETGTAAEGSLQVINPSPAENEKYAAVSLISGQPTVTIDDSTGEAAIEADATFSPVQLKYYYQNESSDAAASAVPAWFGMLLDASGSLSFTFNEPEPIMVDESFPVNQSLSDEQINEILDKKNTDNYALGYANYRYYIISSAENNEYSPLGYWEGNSTATIQVSDRSVIPILADSKYIMGVVHADTPGTAGWYTLSAPRTTEIYETFSTSVALMGKGPVEMYVDENRHLCCNYLLSPGAGTQHTSYVYERKDDNPNRIEVLQSLVSELVLSAEQKFAAPQFSLIRFSTDTFEDEKLLVRNWTDDPAKAISSLNRTYSNGKNIGEEQNDGTLLYNYGVTPDTSTRTGLRAFLRLQGPLTDASQKRVIILMGEGADTDELGTEKDENGFSADDYVQELKNEGYTVVTVLFLGSSGKAEEAETLLSSFAS